MTIEQLRARVAQLVAAVDRAKIDSAQASAQLEKEEDEGTVLSLWARITARKNAGKSLVEQLAAAREELAAAERAAGQERYKAAVKAHEAAYKELAKSAAVTFALAEKAAEALDLVVSTQRDTGEKFKGIPTVGRYGADPYAVACEALGFGILGTWNYFTVARPSKDMPQTPNPYALGLGSGS